MFKEQLIIDKPIKPLKLESPVQYIVKARTDVTLTLQFSIFENKFFPRLF